MKVSYDNHYITRIKDGARMNIFNGWVNEGIEVSIKPFPTSKREHLQQVRSSASRRFIINENGTVSTASNPNLVLGLGYFPKLYLVHRSSTNRAIFKNTHALLQSEQSLFTDYNTGIQLELTSHPTYAITPVSSFIPHRFGIGQMKLGLGPKESALKVVYLKNKLIVCGTKNFYVCYPFQGSSMIIGGSKIPYESQSLLSKLLIFFIFDNISNFSVNNDGTISPLNAPHLALGFQQPTCCSAQELVSEHAYDALQSDRPTNLSIFDLVKYFIIKFFM